VTLFSGLRLRWQAFKTRRKMNRQFGKRVDPFSYSTDPYEIARLEALDAAAGAEPGKVLELSCAEGHLTRRLAARAADLLAVDISARAIERARERAPSARFAEGDLLVWEPGAEGPFDVIVVAEVLYYLDRPGVRAEFAALFPRIASWLKPGGRLVMSHAFAGDAELAHRRSFRERFEGAGLRLVSESVSALDRGGVRCLLSTLEKI
jgi:SAM-dependent methyltransferase